MLPSFSLEHCSIPPFPLPPSLLPTLTTRTHCLHVDFWDTAGQERFNSMHPTYYHQAHACVLVFDVTRKVTYKNLSTWYKEMRHNRPEIPCILVANKIDGEFVLMFEIILSQKGKGSHKRQSAYFRAPQ